MTAVACPACGAPGPADARFCEVCGLDRAAPAAPESPIACWEVVVAADRSHFAALAPAGVAFPEDVEARTVPLEGAEVRIGRRNDRRGIGAELDLSGPPADPGVSHAHALLTRRPDGGYALVDLGSANGTTINDGTEPITARTPVALADGDRIHVGAWTTITIRAVRRTTPGSHTPDEFG